MLLFFVSCNSHHQDNQIQMEAFSDMKTPNFVFDASLIKSNLKKLAKADEGLTSADRQVINYYLANNPVLAWIDRYGIDEQADSLLSWLHLLKEIGLSEKAFCVDDITHDLSLIKSLDFTDEEQSVSVIAARLEYKLTKACLRYCKGQRFGFVDPYRLYNNLDVEKSDSIGNVLKYRQLFDVKMDLSPRNYLNYIIRKVKSDSIASYLREIQPKDPLYAQLIKSLPNAGSAEQKKKCIVNIERSRWRRHQPIENNEKYIVVNIPAYHLYAYNGDEKLDMRIVCGNVKTKTPQLSSYIEWMEINPQWVIPFSIIENEVSMKAGDTAYFARNKYHIYEKASNKEVSVPDVTTNMLKSGKYRVAQEGGEGNSLGRIVFRFKNDFAVFLHDTSNPGAFQRNSRAMSHGCVRVSKPFELARFVLDEPDDWQLDRIRISMGLPAETISGIEFEQEHPDKEERENLISYVTVKPRVPIYIIYYTLWPDMDGVLQTWTDIYGYDEVIWNNLKPYL